MASYCTMVLLRKYNIKCITILSKIKMYVLFTLLFLNNLMISQNMLQVRRCVIYCQNSTYDHIAVKKITHKNVMLCIENQKY